MARQLSNQQISQNNGGEAITNAEGSRWRRGVKVSAGDSANTERTYAENAAHAVSEIEEAYEPQRRVDSKV